MGSEAIINRKMNFLMFSVLILSLYYNTVSCSSSEVPVILWNIKGSFSQLQPVSAFDDGSRNTASDIFEEALNEDSVGFVIFLVDSLSLEDLAIQSSDDGSKSTIRMLESFLDQNAHVIYPNVRDPEKHLRRASCGVDDIYMTPGMEGRLEKAIPAALKHSCVVVVHLPHEAMLENGQVMFDSKIFLPKFNNKIDNIIGVFTSKASSSWEPERNRQSRSLLATEVTDDHFVNITGCLFMYAENITVEVGETANNTALLSFPPEASGKCSNTSSLDLDFGPAGLFTSVVLSFQFENFATAWRMTSASITIVGKDVPVGEVFLLGDIDVPYHFSYSCGMLVLRSDNSTPSVTVKLQGFQIQPAKVQDKFSNSFNCVHWFTLPIWMGTFIVLLFVTILNMGVYFLFQAKTMDRFDDPKGKTLSVPQTE